MTTKSQEKIDTSEEIYTHTDSLDHASLFLCTGKPLALSIWFGVRFMVQTCSNNKGFFSKTQIYNMSFLRQLAEVNLHGTTTKLYIPI